MSQKGELQVSQKMAQAIEAAMVSKVYAMATVCELLPTHQDKDSKDLLTKAVKSLNEKQYALFKYEGLIPGIEEHKESKTAFDNLDKKLVKNPYLSNVAAYAKIPEQISEFLNAGNTKEFFNLAD